MRNRLLGLVFLSGVAIFNSSSAIVAQQRGPAVAAAPQLPPLVYICPMAGDEDVLEEKPGVCPNPKCGMQLEPARLDSKWWCPTHQTLEVANGPGKCRRDGKDLVQVTLSEWWTCPGSDNKLLEPGKCADGSSRRIKYEIRAHGDHNPRHGGQFFMAEDKWHHIEGTYPSAGLFRVYFYDNFTKPMNPKEFTASLVILDKAFKEIASYPMKVGADGTTMEGRIPANQAALPLNAAVRIAFGAGKKPQLFNFPFSAYSKEPAPGAPTGAAAAPAKPQASVAPRPMPFAAAVTSTSRFSFRDLAAAPAQAPAGGQAQAPRIMDSPLQISAELANALDEERLPKDTPALLTTLESRTNEIGTLIAEGNMGQAWLPAMGAKTVALVLDAKSKDLAEGQRIVSAEAAKQIVAAAWEIDEFGDLGNRDKLNGAYLRLTAAVAALKGVYAPSR